MLSWELGEPNPRYALGVQAAKSPDQGGLKSHLSANFGCFAVSCAALWLCCLLVSYRPLAHAALLMPSVLQAASSRLVAHGRFAMASRLFAPASSERVDNSVSEVKDQDTADNEPTKRRSSSLVSCAGCCSDNGLCCGASGLCFDSPQKVKSTWFTAMQELCARHAARFSPLGITLRPWLDTLERRSYKFPGILLAYTPANAPAVVVTAGAVPAAGPVVGTVVAPATGPAVGTVVAPGPAVPTTVAPPPYAAAPTGTVVQAEVVAVAPMDRK